MAIVKGSAALFGLSGALGDLVFKQYKGKTIVAPKGRTRQQNSVLQQMRCDKFREASQYAREILKDPVKREFYRNMAKKLRKHSAYNLLISEFMEDKVTASGTSLRKNEALQRAGNALVDEGNGVSKGNLQRGLGADKGDELVNVKGLELPGCEEAGAGEDNERFCVAGGKGGNATDELAGEGLSIHTAFAGNDEVGAADVVFKVGDAGDKFSTGVDFSRHKQGEHGGEASGSTGAGEVYRPVELRLDDVVEVTEAAIENRDHIRSSAFLGTEYGSSAVGAKERVVYIAEQRTAEVPDCSRYVRQVDAVDKVKVLSDGVQQLAIRAVEAGAKRGGHAYASIVRGGTADAEDERSDVVVGNGVEYYVAGAGG